MPGLGNRIPYPKYEELNDVYDAGVLEKDKAHVACYWNLEKRIASCSHAHCCWWKWQINSPEDYDDVVRA